MSVCKDFDIPQYTSCSNVLCVVALNSALSPVSNYSIFGNVSQSGWICHVVLLAALIP